MSDPISLIAELGLPIASGLIMGFFIFLVMKQLMDNSSELSNLPKKVLASSKVKSKEICK